MVLQQIDEELLPEDLSEKLLQALDKTIVRPFNINRSEYHRLRVILQNNLEYHLYHEMWESLEDGLGLVVHGCL